MHIGLTIGHDSSLAVCDSTGRVIWAASEERFSRLKGHLGAPFLAFTAMKSELGFGEDDLESSHFWVGGEFGVPDESWVLYMLLNPEYQVNFDIFNSGLPPGLLTHILKSSKFLNFSARSTISKLFGANENRIKFINHHDAHAASTFWPSQQEKSLVVTLDGSGDGESGTVSIMNRTGQKRISVRIPEYLSLGHFYSEVTRKYGFKESRHEGKITGLAGSFPRNRIRGLFDDLLGCKNGNLYMRSRYLCDPRLRDRLEIWKQPNHRKAFSLAVSRAESHTEHFAELAAEAQSFLEGMVIKLIAHFKRDTGIDNISLAGGVFSNVSLNSKIREILSPENLYVFPNMGDGGLSVGAVWEGMRLSGSAINRLVVNDMYLGDNLVESNSSNLIRRPVSPEELADLIINDRIVGLVTGRMEFGPRALCHRSIIASPSNESINATLNARLRRTEFMPFAPVVREVDFAKVFEGVLPDLKFPNNFSFMTETIRVRDFWLDKIPGVVHVDGTARPQIIKRSDNSLLYDTLEILTSRFGIPVVINTSFNTHEEPIIRTEDEAILELKRGKIDVLISNGNTIELLSSD